MSGPSIFRPSWRAVRRMVGAAALSVAGTILVTASAHADDSAKTILKAMSDYVASQKTIQVAFDTDIEVITSDLQKIQFASSGSLLLSRPDKLRATRTGGYADIELVFDGKARRARRAGRRAGRSALADRLRAPDRSGARRAHPRRRASRRRSAGTASRRRPRQVRAGRRRVRGCAEAERGPPRRPHGARQFSRAASQRHRGGE